jgi:phage shock protein PspC (stress-responsive transcriptional regulator)
MNKVITINLDGTAYQLEEAGYDILRVYLESATAQLQGNPDHEEILSDIERAIGEKFRALLNNYKTVVATKEVTAVVAEMGPIEADPGDGAGQTSEGKSGSTSAGGQGTANPERPGQHAQPPKRLYRIHEGAMLAGVCNGLAAYLNIDPTLVRLAFVLLTLLWGSGLLVYIIMAIVVPEARSPEEKSAASGAPSTAQEFIRRAREGYYEAMKAFPDRKARREWKRRFNRQMRGWGLSFDQQMRSNAHQWSDNWHRHWGEHAPLHPSLGFVLPFVSLLQGAATVLLILACVSLLNTSTLFGFALPAHMPLWGAALMLFVAYGILTSPLKAARRACYGGCGQPGWIWPFVVVLDVVTWVAVAAVFLWMAVHFFPELREAAHNIPALAHQAAEDLRGWWK